MTVLLGNTDFIHAKEKQRKLLAQEMNSLLPRNFDPNELHAHFTTLPPRYFQIHPVKEILSDLTSTHRFMHHQLTKKDKTLEPIIT